MKHLESFQSRSFRFALDILKLYRALQRSENLPPHLPNQLLRAGTAIGANLAEAINAYSRRDLANRQMVALREARETNFWLRIIKVDQPGFTKDIDPLLQECGELIAMLTTSVRKLRQERKKAAVTAAAVVAVLLLATL